MNQMRFIIALTAALLLASLTSAQPRQPTIDVQDYQVDLELIPQNSYLRGTAKIRFKVLEDAVSVPFELSSRLSLIEVNDEAGEVYSPRFDNLDSSRMLVRGTEPFKKGSERQLTFLFDGTLESEQYAYLDDTPSSEKAVIGTDGALLLTEGKWFPSHQLALDSAQVQLKISVPLGFSVVAPGKLQALDNEGVNEIFRWHSDRPLNGVPVTVRRYFRQSFPEKGSELTFFVTEDFDGDLKPLAQSAAEIIEFFRSLFGDLPNGNAINLVQVGNIDIPSATSDGLILLDDQLLMARQIPLMKLARLLAKQWWKHNLYIGGGFDAWLQDGFASYAALHYIEVKHPDRFDLELAKMAVEALKYEEQAPISGGLALGPGSPQYESIVEAKGAWVLYMLRQLTGDKQFQQWFQDWYRTHAGGVVTTPQLVDFANLKTGEDYSWFFLQWVESTGVPEFRVDYKIFKKTAAGFKIRGQIKQELDLFRMPIDVSIETKGEAEEKRVFVSGKNTNFLWETETMPVKILLDPKGKVLRGSQMMRVSVYIALGEELRQRGEYVSAIREFERAKALDERSSYAHFRLGETFFLQHSYSNAANSLRMALDGDLKPEWVETWTHIYLGKIYDVLGQRQRAQAEYQKAINSGIDYNGAQAEAQKYSREPFSKPRTLIN